MIARLREGLPPEARAIGVGEELPPERADAVRPRRPAQLRLGGAGARAWHWLDPIFEPSTAARTSRRDLTWASAIRALDRLRESCVGAIVGATPPPAGSFARVEKAGRAWIAWLDARALGRDPLADGRDWTGAGNPDGPSSASASRDPTACWCARRTTPAGRPSSTAGRAPLRPGTGPFLEIDIPSGEHTIHLILRPARSADRAGDLGVHAGGLDSRLDRIPPLLNSWNNAKRGLDGPEPPS